MSARKGSNPLHALLSENDALRPLLGKARHIQALQQIYIDALPNLFGEDLPEQFARASRVTAIVGTTIVVGVASASIGTRIKQIAPRLLSLFQKQEQEVTEIRVEVQPDWQTVTKAGPGKHAGKPRTPIPESTLDTLEDILSDSPLKDAVAQIRKGHSRSKRSQN
jgi:hypothetical protein